MPMLPCFIQAGDTLINLSNVTGIQQLPSGTVRIFFNPTQEGFVDYTGDYARAIRAALVAKFGLELLPYVKRNRQLEQDQED